MQQEGAAYDPRRCPPQKVASIATLPYPGIQGMGLSCLLQLGFVQQMQQQQLHGRDEA